MKETLSSTYRDGIGSVHLDLQRKNWWKIYKVSLIWIKGRVVQKS